jgi:hypothetical protein
MLAAAVFALVDQMALLVVEGPQECLFCCGAHLDQGHCCPWRH